MLLSSNNVGIMDPENIPCTASLGDGQPPMDIIPSECSAPSERPMHQKINNLIHACEMQPVEFPVRHHFSPGVYARELFVAAGRVAVGKVHKFENMLILAAGEAEFLLGDKPVRVCAPQVWVSPPGTQRAVFAHTDCTFISVHGTDKRDVDEIEAEFICQNMLEYEQYRLALEHKGE